MNEFKNDMNRIQELISSSFAETGSLVAMAHGGVTNGDKLQWTLEQTLARFEKATMELRVLCERNSPGIGGYEKRPVLPGREVTGSVDRINYTWLHITLKTLLPHCRFQTPSWLSDTIRRLLDDYESAGGIIPFYGNDAVLILDEHSRISHRSVYDQDNKGWKAVSNALKGRAFPDDDQYSLGVILLASESGENVTHITVMDVKDAGDFLTMRSRYASASIVYMGI